MKKKRSGVEEIAVSDLKARCSEIVDLVASKGREFVITRHGTAVARLVASDAHRRSPRGSWKGLVHIGGDIVSTDWSDEFEVMVK